MILETSPTSLGQDELVKQLRTFLAGAGASTRNQPNPQLSATALHLLTHLPASREAVLEYFGSVLDGIVSRYNPQQERDSSGFNEDVSEIILDDLSRALSSLVTSTPSPWAPIVSSWSLDCLGKLSTKWSTKICGKQGQNPTQLLHEKMSAWLGCSAARVLLDLAADCLAKLMDSKVDTKMEINVDYMMSDTESCVAALLETSVKHTPHFDWVVAHIGSCFPSTVTHRVLSVGLKDFIVASKEGEGDNLIKVPRLLSVVNILSHLATTHQIDLQRAVHSLLTASLNAASPSPSHIATVPFLISLSTHSSGVRRALTSGLASLLTPFLDRISVLFSSWIKNYFPNSSILLSTVTQLLLQTDRDGPELMLLLLKAGADQGVVATAARTIMNCLLSDIFNQVHGTPKHRIEEVAVFFGMPNHLHSILEMLLLEDSFQLSAATQLICLYCIQKGRSVSSQVLKFLLGSCTKEQQLSVVVQVLGQLEQFHNSMVSEAVQAGLKDKRLDLRIFLRNLAKMSQMESGVSQSWIRAISNCQVQLAEQLVKEELTDMVIEVFRLVPPSTKMRVNALHKICHSFVQVVLNIITSSNLSLESRTVKLSSCEKILHQLCQQHCGLQMTLRFFLDSCLNSPYCEWFGGSQEPEENSVRQNQAASLLKENHKFGVMPIQPLGSTTVFHAGTIGAGAREFSSNRLVTLEQAEINRRTVSGLIMRLCERSGEQGEGAKQLALMMVEIISPDIMYNGLPWPEEEFMKVTIERDLSITRLLMRHPLAWLLLTVLAQARPALCYCSVLVRAVVAVSISHWASHVTSKLTDHPAQLSTTKKVLELMAVGQFLPPQLALVPQIIHIFDPFQLHCVLIDIWNFMKITVPGPSLFQISEASGEATRDFGPYKSYHGFCERLRVVIVKNIDTMAVIFKKYFVDALKETGENGQNGHVEP